MALTRYGYTGTVNQQQWAQIMGIAGNAYGIQDFSGLGWTASPVAAARQTSMAPGKGVGHGVLVVTDAAEVLTHAAPAAGRWDLISMRRDWGTPANTGFVVTPHETLTTNALPAAVPSTFPSAIAANVRNAALNAGVGVDYEPLYWVWVNASNTNLAYYDLRSLPLSSRIADSGWVPITFAGAWGNYGGFANAAVRKIGKTVKLRGLVSGGATAAGSQIATIPVGFRPAASFIGLAIGPTSTAALDFNNASGAIAAGASALSPTYTSLELNSWLVD